MGEIRANAAEAQAESMVLSEVVPGSVRSEGMTLATVANLHEGIKRIVNTARTINVEALNALLRAKKVGTQAVGFGASSSELRRFSTRLGAVMGQLTAEIGGQVKNVAAMQVSRKMLRYDRGAMAQIKCAGNVLGKVIERKESELSEIEIDVAQGRLRLRLRLQQAEKICQVGMAVARASKIEAVYGGAMAGQLNQVSCGIEMHIEEMIRTIKNLLRHN